MDIEGIKNLINAMDNSTLDYLEVNWQGVSLVMKKSGEPVETRITKTVPVPEVSKEILISRENIPEVSQVKPESQSKKASEEETEENIFIVTSPIVGTFYEAPGPKKPRFVSVGSKVKAGDTLCIIEAMKLMNEIKSEVDGEIVEVLVKNEEMVEYNQPLFKIKVR